MKKEVFEKLKETMPRIKKDLGLDFARYNIDSLGDCSSCVSAGIACKYGENAIGIYVKMWNYGMNRSTERDRENWNQVYIGHWLNKDFGKKVIDYLNNIFIVENQEYNEYECITILGLR